MVEIRPVARIKHQKNYSRILVSAQVRKNLMANNSNKLPVYRGILAGDPHFISTVRLDNTANNMFCPGDTSPISLSIASRLNVALACKVNRDVRPWIDRPNAGTASEKQADDGEDKCGACVHV